MMKNLIILLITIIFVDASAQDLKYFNSDIDYWNNSKKEEVKEKKEVKKVIKTEKQSSKEKKFSWKKYESEHSDEFWKEGNHVTPKIVQKVSIIVSDKKSTEKQKKRAIKAYQNWINKKNIMKNEFITALMKYSERPELPKESKAYMKSMINKLPKDNIDNSKISFEMFFRTTCPHCKRMFETFRELHHKGFYVEAKQVDRGHLKVNNYPFIIKKATNEEVALLDQSGVTGVPFTIVFIQGYKNLHINGYQTRESLFSLIQNHINKGGR